jgi:hypothetical protein
MKKLTATFLAISIFAIVATADDGQYNPLKTTCLAGHINSPGVTCTPPPHGNQMTTEMGEDSDTIFTAISKFFSEYDLFESF